MVFWDHGASVVANLESICGLPKYAADAAKEQHHLRAEVEETQMKTVEHRRWHWAAWKNMVVMLKKKKNL